jgi:hypothetical protein
MPEIQIHICTEDGVDLLLATQDLKVGQFVTEVAKEPKLNMPRTDAAGIPIDWELEDKNTRRRLEAEKTLSENGVRGGDWLLIRSRRRDGGLVCPSCGNENPGGGKYCNQCGQRLIRDPQPAGDIKLHLFSPSGGSHSMDAPASFKVSELLETAIRVFALATSDPKGAPVVWTLYDRDAGGVLDPERSLEENGVRNEHQLDIREIKKLPPSPPPEPIPPKRVTPPPLIPWKVIASLAAVVLVAFSACLVYRISQPAISVSLSPSGTLTETAGQSVLFSVTVSGTSNKGVVWTLSPPLALLLVGKIENGRYVAPTPVVSDRVMKRTETSDV